MIALLLFHRLARILHGCCCTCACAHVRCHHGRILVAVHQAAL